MHEVIAAFAVIALFGGFGYYILPWIMHGVSPRETWRQDHER